MRIQTILIGLAACAGALTSVERAAGDDLKFVSPDGRRTHLVELYTSEGCSSCPPAESWLSKLTSSPKLWTEVVPVAFHVDYWDNLGWRDRFASPASTTRQRAYAAAWGSNSVYTPGLVLDGHEWRDWSGYAVGTLPPSALQNQSADRLSAVVKGGKTVTVSYQPASQAASAWKASVALLGCDLASDVKAGENRGRSLRHDFVVLSCESKKLLSNKTDGTAIFELPAPPPGDAKRLALAVWVEEPGRAGIQQAVGGWLNAASKQP